MARQSDLVFSRGYLRGIGPEFKLTLFRQGGLGGGGDQDPDCGPGLARATSMYLGEETKKEICSAKNGEECELKIERRKGMDIQG